MTTIPYFAGSVTARDLRRRSPQDTAPSRLNDGKQIIENAIAHVPDVHVELAEHPFGSQTALVTLQNAQTGPAAKEVIQEHQDPHQTFWRKVINTVFELKGQPSGFEGSADTQDTLSTFVQIAGCGV